MNELRVFIPPFRKYYSGKYLTVEPGVERSWVKENTVIFFFFYSLGSKKQYTLLLKVRVHFQCKFPLSFFSLRVITLFFYFLLQWLIHLKNILCSADRVRITSFLISNKGYTCTLPRFQLVILEKPDLFHGHSVYLRNISMRIESVSYS